MLINDASITGSLIVNASASLQNISLGGNIIPDETNLRNLGSTEKFFKEIYVSTGSINFVDGGNIVAVLSAGTITAIQSNTSSANSRLNAIESVSASLQSFTASISTTNTFTSSATARLNALETSSASVDTLNTTQSNRLGSLETISASNISRITALETTSASVDTLNSTQNSRLSALETTSASVDTLNTNQNSRLSSLEIKTGSLATTGSNTFIGTQTITGSLFISSDLVVQGTSSLQNITASAVSIGTNLINLNTANPAIRFAGLVIGDSGSIGSSGSFLYDSVQDEMIFVHRGASTVVTSSVTLMGPETYDNVGNETYLTSNRIPKGTGNEHLGDSCIFDNGTTVCINANLVGSGTGMFSSTVSATQYTATSTGGSGLRIYGAAGANQWDMYLNSTNLRFSDNTGTGNIVFDRPLNGTSAVFSGNIAIGTNPASAAAGGVLRLPFDNAIRWRNSSNTADVGFYLGTGNLFTFDSGISVTGAATFSVGGNRTVLISNDSVDTGYNVISLNGTRTKGSYSGIAGGATGDNNLYLNSADGVIVQTGASLTERMRITSSGTVSTACNLSVGTSADAGGGFGTMIAYQPYGAASFSCNLNVLPDGTYIVTASMVRGGDGVNQTYSAMFIYHHYISSGGTDIINTIVSSTAPGNNNGQLSLSGTTVSIGWGGARGPASISALRLRTS